VKPMSFARASLLFCAFGGLGSLGCQYGAATDACYALVEAIGARLATCGVVATPEEGEQLVIDDLASDGLNCDTSPVSLRDEDIFYDQCIPEIAEMDCTSLALPVSCADKIYYRSR